MSKFLTYCTTYVGAGLVWWSSSLVILSVRDLGIFTLFRFSCLLIIWIKEGRVTIVYGSSQFYHESGAAFSWETDSVAMSCVILHARQPLPVNFGHVNFPFCILVNIYSVHTSCAYTVHSTCELTRAACTTILVPACRNFHVGAAMATPVHHVRWSFLNG